MKIQYILHKILCTCSLMNLNRISFARPFCYYWQIKQCSQISTVANLDLNEVGRAEYGVAGY